MRIGLAAGFLAACCLGLVACDPGVSVEPASSGSTVLPTHRDLQSGPDGLQRGTIVMSGSCVVLEEAVQHLRWLIVWPAGYQLRDTVVVSGEGQPIARVGDTVDLGGGEYKESQYAFLKTLLATEPAAACRVGNYWLATDITRR